METSKPMKPHKFSVLLITVFVATVLVNCKGLKNSTQNKVQGTSSKTDSTSEILIPRFKSENAVLRLESEKIPSTDHMAQMRKQPFIHQDELLDENDLISRIDKEHPYQISQTPRIDTLNYVDPNKLYQSALSKYYNQEYFDASIDLDKAIYEKPNFSLAYYRRGECRSALGDFVGAMKDFETAANSDKLNNDIRKVAHLQCGVMREKLNKYGEAIVHYDLALQLDSSYQDAYKRRGQTNQLLGNYDEAITDYKVVLKLDSSNLKVRYQLARSYHENENYKKAIAHYNKILDKKPTYTPAYFYRGMANYEIKRYHSALKDYDRVIHLNPKDEEAHFDRGLVFFELKMYKEALFEFEVALELDPEDMDARINRALCKFQGGETDAAIREFNKVLRQDSTNIDAHINVGIIEMEKEQYNKAKDHFSKVIELEPNNPEAYFYRGMANYETNDKRSACLDFEISNSKKYPGAMHMIKQYCNDKGGN